MDPTILIVHYEPVTRYLLRLILENAGFRIIEADYGLDALQKARRDQPSAILLDGMRQDVSGFVVCKMECAAADFSVLMLRARTQLEVTRRILQAPASRYIPSPATVADVVESLRAVLAGSALPESTAPKIQS